VFWDCLGASDLRTRVFGAGEDQAEKTILLYDNFRAFTYFYFTTFAFLFSFLIYFLSLFDNYFFQVVLMLIAAHALCWWKVYYEQSVFPQDVLQVSKNILRQLLRSSSHELSLKTSSE